LSATGRKFLRGPRGTGFLYVSDKILQSDLAPLFVDLGGATWSQADDFNLSQTAKRFEMWEISYASMIGLKEAIKYANEVGIQNIQQYTAKLSQTLRTKLSSIPEVTVYDKGEQLSSLVTFRKANLTLEQTQNHLNQHRVFHSTSTREMAQIDFEEKGMDWVIRISPHYFNTLEEVEKLCEIVEGM